MTRNGTASCRIVTSLLFLVAPVHAEAPRALQPADYARAEQFMPYRTAPLVMNLAENVTWLPGGKLWYLTRTNSGESFVLVDPRRHTKQPAFDQARLAAALSASAATKYEAAHLPFRTFDLSADDTVVSFDSASKHWTCELPRDRCSESAKRKIEESVSPDRARVAFVRNYNLWVRDVSSGRETPLTTDGVKDFGYATDDSGPGHADSAIVLWSPDSQRLATFQADQRGVGDMYLVRGKAGHPELKSWKFAMAGDGVIPTIRRVIIDVESAKVVTLAIPPDLRRASSCHDLHCGDNELVDSQWSPDSRHLAFISTSREHKHVTLREADATTGAVRGVLEESVRSFYDTDISSSYKDAVNWRYLPESGEVIWFSERDNWAHLYLYDLRTGKLRHQITRGDWNVVELLRVDERRRVLYLSGVGREAGRDPYFVHLYKVGFDGKGLSLLTPEDATHEVSMAPSGEYFVDRYSRPDVPPVAVLRDRSGRLVSTLEKGDISPLLSIGWKPPVPVTVKARDGVTDLYGLVFRPTSFDPGKKYPIVDFIYPGPQLGSVGSRHFTASRGDRQSLAELGFVVVAFDGMGTPLRSKAFHDTYYGNMRDNTLPDQVAAIRQLAERHPWIDLDRVGIYGHSGGGYATAAAMFDYPNVFKVGVAESGNHDQRGYADDWGEKYIGLLERKPDGSSNYDSQGNETVAGNLKGHLLLMHGTLDDNVPPYLTLLVADALIQANKDFDLLLLPNQQHDYEGQADNYATRRRWDYFVRYLLGAEPPREYQLHRPAGNASPTDWEWW